MNNDDSFNDSDELFSLYSSQKITNIFKAQVKKIAASNLSTSVDVPPAKNEDNKFVDDCVPTVGSDKEKEETFPEKENLCEEVVYKTPQASPEIVDELEENSIEIISEVSPGTRRSARLRRKEPSQANHIPINFNSRGINRRNCRGRRKGGRGNKQINGNHIDEIILVDSPPPDENEDDLNPELTVKVIWKSVNIKKFNIRKFQKLGLIFELLSKEEGIPEEKIILTFQNSKVNRNDTPDSLNLQVYHFLDGGVLSELSNVSECQAEPVHNLSGDLVTLKFQDVNKRTIKLSLNRNEKLKVGMIKCSEQLETPLEKIRFFFDGDLLDPSETPDSLGLENDEVIDIKISC